MKRQGLTILIVMLLLGFSVHLVDAQGDEVRVSVQLRAADGAPVVDELISLLPFAVELAHAQPCRTNGDGLCTWHVQTGLYELLSDKPLDELSRYAVAEGGLRGLGITVGDTPITYTLTIQPDSFLYFDSAPNFQTPVPFIPTEANTHLAFTPTMTDEISVERTTVISAENASDNPTATETISVASPAASNRLLAVVGIGLGVGIALLPRLRRYLQGERHA